MQKELCLCGYFCFMNKKIVFATVILLILGGLQFVPVEMSNPDMEPEKDFLSMSGTPEGMATQIREACYDCHSFETRYPWYSKIAPVSFLISNHINEGREHLNFSAWGDYGTKKQNHKLEECFEMIENGEMPMKGYVVFHSAAKLSNEGKNELIAYFKSLYEGHSIAP